MGSWVPVLGLGWSPLLFAVDDHHLLPLFLDLQNQCLTLSIWDKRRGKRENILLLFKRQTLQEKAQRKLDGAWITQKQRIHDSQPLAPSKKFELMEQNLEK